MGRGRGRSRMTRRGLLLFAAMCVIWGIPYLLIRIAVTEISPATLVFLRTSIALLVLLPFARPDRTVARAARVLSGRGRRPLVLPFECGAAHLERARGPFDLCRAAG